MLQTPIADVPGDEGVTYRFVRGTEDYGVGDDGSAWSHKSGEWKRLKPIFNTRYCNITVNQHPHRLHKLVLEAFVGPRPAGMVACHYPDPDTRNNRLSNLRWSTQKENWQDTIRAGRSLTGSRNHQSKLTEDQVVELRRRYAGGEPSTKLAPQYGISVTMACAIIRRKRWTHV